MNIEEIIEHKRDKKILTKEEIRFFIERYVADEIKDYQASALLMAIYLNGMNKQEIADLTEEMRISGEVWDLSDISGIKVDKHSTGGVGDKVSLIVGPIVAACGGKLAKMSGRGLGHTGGTLDKLESIPGFSVYKTKEEFKKQVNEVGMVIIGQNERIDPADKKLYALRDVTATVGCVPLIASSIMSKKLASGADAILLDVKYGSGAFMKTIEDAKILGSTMVELGKSLNKKVKAEITDMNQPLGCAVGNNLEVIEAINTLKGNGPKDITDICVSSSSILLEMSGIFKSRKDAEKAVIESIRNGSAFEKFKEFVKAQGGDVSFIENPDKFEKSKFIKSVVAQESGYITSINALEIGTISMHLGGGRATLDDVIDMSAGVILYKKVGDFVSKGDVLCELHTNRMHHDKFIDIARNSFVIKKEKPQLSNNITALLIE